MSNDELTRVATTMRLLGVVSLKTPQFEIVLAPRLPVESVEGSDNASGRPAEAAGEEDLPDFYRRINPNYRRLVYGE